MEMLHIFQSAVSFTYIQYSAKVLDTQKENAVKQQCFQTL